MDDKNARGTSLQQLQDVVQLTESFDEHTDAVVNLRKTFCYYADWKKILTERPAQQPAGSISFR